MKIQLNLNLNQHSSKIYDKSHSILIKANFKWNHKTFQNWGKLYQDLYWKSFIVVRHHYKIKI